MARSGQGRINVEIHGSTATVELDNPGQRNALTRVMCLQLCEALAQLGAAPQVASVVLRGAGGHFSAGIAIDQMDQVLFDRDADGTLVNHFDAVDRVLGSCPKPTIAVVQGNCFGGAWQLAAACDMQLASDDVQIAITPAKIGLVFPRPGIERLVRTVGEHRASYLLLTGASLPVAQAVQWGLFTELVPAAELPGRLEQLLAALAANSPYALRRTKEAIAATLRGAPESAHERWWQELWAENAANPDLAEGRAAFLERRPPSFGR